MSPGDRLPGFVPDKTIVIVTVVDGLTTALGDSGVTADEAVQRSRSRRGPFAAGDADYVYCSQMRRNPSRNVICGSQPVAARIFEISAIVSWT